VGWACPGFGTVDEMSSRHFIDQINASKADFLIVALGASKGQAWLQRNHHLLRVPIRAHLGAVINFEAGTVTRAPRILRGLGLEWLWRIKEEPGLSPRYWHDGKTLLRVFITQVLPLAMTARLHRSNRGHDFVMVETQNDHTLTIQLRGHALAPQASQAASQFRRVLEARRQVVLDCSDLVMIDARFLGLLLMLRKQLMMRGYALQFSGVSPALDRQFRRNQLKDVFNTGGDNAVGTAR
jgi:N-acetylglucosaminyldiphosphoundecaprenol N-acetyl-beta-D-mannosaminyltransferase